MRRPGFFFRGGPGTALARHLASSVPACVDLSKDCGSVSTLCPCHSNDREPIDFKIPPAPVAPAPVVARAAPPLRGAGPGDRVAHTGGPRPRDRAGGARIRRLATVDDPAPQRE